MGIVQINALEQAVKQASMEAQFPFNLTLVQDESGDTRLVTVGDGYGVAINKRSTTDDIFDLEDQLERVGDTALAAYGM